MSKIVKQTARVLFPLIAVFSFYVILHGHLTPGGGFQGGVILASGVALVLVAFGRKAVKEYRPTLKMMFSMFSSFMIIYFIAHFIHHSMHLSSPLGRGVGELFSAGGIPIMSFFVGLEVMVGMTIIIILVRRAG